MCFNVICKHNNNTDLQTLILYEKGLRFTINEQIKTKNIHIIDLPTLQNLFEECL